MAFDKSEFRRKAQARAIRERVQKVRARVQARLREEGVEAPAKDTEENLSLEERKVLQQYRQWKQTRESAVKGSKTVADANTRSAALREKIAKRIRENEQVPADGEEDESDPSTANKPGTDVQKVGSGKTITQKQLETRRDRVAKLRRKLEKRARIARIKERIAERRESVNDTVSSTKIREEAQQLKRRISRVRRMIENDMMQQPQQPQQPTGAQSQMMDPNAGMGMDQAAPQLPPEVVAEIQNISTAAQNLAALAGVQPTDALGADAEAGIGAETGAGAEGMEQGMQQPVMERRINSLRKKKILEAIKKRRAAKSNDADTIVESTRARVAERREALKKLRAQALKEDYKSEGAEESTGQIKSEVDAYMGNNHNDPKIVIHQQGRKIDGPSPSMPGKKSLKPAKVWPTKPAKSQRFESEVNDDEPLTEEQIAEQEVMQEAGWDEKHVSHYLEKKELDFRSMIKQGLLG